jgi:hypothetical protein
MHTIFSLENKKERDHSEDLGTDGKIILEKIFGKWWKGVDWMRVVQNREQWRLLVNTVMNLRNFSLAE